MDKVERQEFIKEMAQVETLKDAKNLKFDSNNRYLVSYGETSINVIDLLENDDPPFHVIIDQEKFDRIVDIQFVSTS